MVLNLDDVEEERELEELEDGRCGGDEVEEESGDDEDPDTALPQPQAPPTSTTTCNSHHR